MKKVVLIILALFISAFSVFMIMSCDNKLPSEEPIKLIMKKNHRFSDRITTTNGITFKCSLNYAIGTRKKNSDILFKLKDKSNQNKTIIISCDKTLVRVDYYSYENEIIYTQKIKNKEWLKIDEDYCKKDCRYAIVFVRYKKKLYCAKFIRREQ